MPTYNSTKFLTLPQQVNKNKKDIEALQEVEINLNNYIPKTEKGEPLGVATLDANGKVPASQVPTNPNNYLEKSGGTMSGPIDMGNDSITDAAYIQTFYLNVKEIISGSAFQGVKFGSDIDLNSQQKIIGAIKGTGLTDMATIENVNDHDDSPFSHPDIRNEILSLKGAWILRGVVEFTTANVTQTRLNDRIQALMSRSALLGDVLVDLDSHEWYFNGTIWNDFGQANIGLATSISDGLMSSSQFTKLSGLQTGLQIEFMVRVQKERIDDLIPIVADKEDEVNKVTDFSRPNNTTFPTTLAVDNLVNGVKNELEQDINNLKAEEVSTSEVGVTVQNKLDEIDTKESLSNKAVDFSVVNDTKYPTTKAVAERLLNLPIAELNNHTLKEVFEDGNLVVNGDFSNGTTGWDNDGTSVLSISNNNLVITGNGGSRYLFVYQSNIFNINDKIYFKSRVKLSHPASWISIYDGNQSNNRSDNPPINGWINVTNILDVTGDNVYILADYLDTTNQNGASIEVQYVYSINLNAFGISSLTVYQMDYWFSVYQGLKTSETDIMFSLFAPKQLPAWITPTLTGATSTYIRYRKDTLGSVIVEGNITVTTAGTNFTLPTGYRPLFVYTVGKLTFNTDGTVVSSETGNESISVRFTGGV